MHLPSTSRPSTTTKSSLTSSTYAFKLRDFKQNVVNRLSTGPSTENTLPLTKRNIDWFNDRAVESKAAPVSYDADDNLRRARAAQISDWISKLPNVGPR